MNILVNLLQGILDKLPSDVVKKSLDKALDPVEEWIEKSDNKVDDALLLPAIKWLRTQIGIEETEGSGFEDGSD